MKGQPFGKRLAVARERSLRTHLLAATALLAVLLATRPAPLWWALLAVAVGLVLVAELFNSALETLLDHLHPGQHPEIGAAKDIAAGAVLVACAVAVLAGAAFLLDGLA